MRRRASTRERRAGGLALLTLALAALPACDGCSRRKPLPRSPDAGPAVQLVDRQVGPAVQVVSQPLVEEREPDDDRDHAQPLEPGKGIRGSIEPGAASAAGGAAGKADEDWYSYVVQDPAPAPEGGQPGVAPRPQELRLQLVPGPGADLSLEILDGDGARLLLLDDRAAGQSEAAALVQRLGQSLYLRVRPSPRQRQPLSGEAAAYQLLVAQAAAPAGSEVEPNETPQQAQDVLGGAPLSEAGADLSGLLQTKKDEDWFALMLPGGDGGAQRGAILRVELSSPGVVPALKLAGEDGAVILEARGVGEELRLRNAGLPPGARRVLVGVRALSLKKGEGRYQLRVAVEPPLDGAEVEPNDRCEQASALPANGEVAGFLWPGDEDCFRLALPGPSTVGLRLQQEGDCQAELRLPGEAGKAGATELAGLQRSGEVLVRVVGRSQKNKTGCFEAPYRLQSQLGPPAPGAPSGTPSGLPTP